MVLEKLRPPVLDLQECVQRSSEVWQSCPDGAGVPPARITGCRRRESLTGSWKNMTPKRS